MGNLAAMAEQTSCQIFAIAMERKPTEIADDRLVRFGRELDGSYRTNKKGDPRVAFFLNQPAIT